MAIGSDQRIDHFDRDTSGTWASFMKRQGLEAFSGLTAIDVGIASAGYRTGKITVELDHASWMKGGPRSIETAKNGKHHLLTIGTDREVSYTLGNRKAEAQPIKDDDRAVLRDGVPADSVHTLLSEEGELDKRRNRLAWGVVEDLVKVRAGMFNPSTSPFENITTLAILGAADDLAVGAKWDTAAARPSLDIAAARRACVNQGWTPNAIEIQWTLVEALLVHEHTRGILSGVNLTADLLGREQVLALLSKWAQVPAANITILGAMADTSAAGSKILTLSNVFEPAFRLYRRGSPQMMPTLTPGQRLIELDEPITSMWLFEDMSRGYATGQAAGFGFDFDEVSGRVPFIGNGRPITAYREWDDIHSEQTRMQIKGFWSEVAVCDELNYTVGDVVG